MSSGSDEHRLTLTEGVLRALGSGPRALEAARDLIGDADADEQTCRTELRAERGRLREVVAQAAPPAAQPAQAAAQPSAAPATAPAAKPVAAPEAAPAPAKAATPEGSGSQPSPVPPESQSGVEQPRPAPQPSGKGWVKRGEGGGGAPSPRVKGLQARLNEVMPESEPLLDDGDFGPKTHDALKAFQRLHGLPQTGALDGRTLEAIRVPPPRTLEMNRIIAREMQAGGAEVGFTDRGPAVAAVQGKLVQLGYDAADQGEHGEAVFGRRTQAAIRRIQREAGMVPTGNADVQTMAVLERQLALALAPEPKAAKEPKQKEIKRAPRGKSKVLEATVVGPPPGVATAWGGANPIYSTPAQAASILAQKAAAILAIPDEELPDVLRKLSGPMAERVVEAAQQRGRRGPVKSDSSYLEAQHRRGRTGEWTPMGLTGGEPRKPPGWKDPGSDTDPIRKPPHDEPGALTRAATAVRDYDPRKKPKKKLKEAEMQGELAEVSSSALPDLPNKKGKTNWVENTGGLPSYIERIAKHLHSERGKSVSSSIAIAVGTVRRWCAGGSASARGGASTSNVSAATKAKACKAIAQWEAQKKASKAQTAAKKVAEGAWPATFAEALALAESAVIERVDALGQTVAHRPIPPSLNFSQKLLEEVEMAHDDWGSWEDGEPPAVELGEGALSTKARDSLPDAAFVFPKDRRYPIHDKAHARNALARVAQHGTAAEKAKVRAAVRAKHPGVGVSETAEWANQLSEADLAAEPFYRVTDGVPTLYVARQPVAEFATAAEARLAEAAAKRFSTRMKGSGSKEVARKSVEKLGADFDEGVSEQNKADRQVAAMTATRFRGKGATPSTLQADASGAPAQAKPSSPRSPFKGAAPPDKLPAGAVRSRLQETADLVVAELEEGLLGRAGHALTHFDEKKHRRGRTGEWTDMPDAPAFVPAATMAKMTPIQLNDHAAKHEAHSERSPGGMNVRHEEEAARARAHADRNSAGIKFPRSSSGSSGARNQASSTEGSPLKNRSSLDDPVAVSRATHDDVKAAAARYPSHKGIQDELDKRQGRGATSSGGARNKPTGGGRSLGDDLVQPASESTGEVRKLNRYVTKPGEQVQYREWDESGHTSTWSRPHTVVRHSETGGGQFLLRDAEGKEHWEWEHTEVQMGHPKKKGKKVSEAASPPRTHLAEALRELSFELASADDGAFGGGLEEASAGRFLERLHRRGRGGQWIDMPDLPSGARNEPTKWNAAYEEGRAGKPLTNKNFADAHRHGRTTRIMRTPIAPVNLPISLTPEQEQKNRDWVKQVQAKEQELDAEDQAFVDKLEGKGGARNQPSSTPLELLDREKSGGRSEWIKGRNPYFISHHEDGDELWLSHRPYGVNDRIHKFPKGHTPTLEDVDDAIRNPGQTGARSPGTRGGGGDDLAVDMAIGGVLASFPGLTDWSLAKKGDGWELTVEMGKDKHKISVSADGTVEEIKSPGKPATAKVTEPSGSTSPPAHVETYYLTGDEEKPFHMDPGQVFKGKDGNYYRKVGNTKKQGKKGMLAAVEIENLSTGEKKVTPAFALGYYELAMPGDGLPHQPPPGAPAQDEDSLFGDLKKSVGGDKVVFDKPPPGGWTDADKVKPVPKDVQDYAASQLAKDAATTKAAYDKIASKTSAFQTGRGPTGKLRNFKAMGDQKFKDAYFAIADDEQNDPEAMAAVQAEWLRRYGKHGPVQEAANAALQRVVNTALELREATGTTRARLEARLRVLEGRLADGDRREYEQLRGSTVDRQVRPARVRIRRALGVR